MFQIHEMQIADLILHHFSQESIHEKISHETIEIDDEVDGAVLLHLFTKPFMKPQSTYNFHHEVDIDFNVLQKLTQSLWEEDLSFVEYSQKAFTHLKEVSEHPNIKDGDFFVIRFKNLLLNDTHRQAIGLYKVEQMESFLTTDWKDTRQAHIALQQGIHEGKLDKACLIVDLPSGPELYIIDQNKEEAAYWKHDFIQVELKNDHYNQTMQTLVLTQHFIKEQFPHEFNVERVDQIDLMNKSMDYFKSADTFKQEEFEQAVLQDEHLITSYRNFQEQTNQGQGWTFEDDFVMVPEAVKKNQRFYKSIIKLDKNFHIYVHGNPEMIEQGEDDDGRRFYKLYFEEEH
ncbi:MAG TPA: nucleoid-associated protein [Chitinophagaceae bacterium]|nr:nucleoid-associated protein [Chitinophagaceae bacterium]